MKLDCQTADRELVGRTRRGTTLIELLVVIVIFLIGILAVIQIFPKGFQLLVVTRNNSVAVHLAEAEVERLKIHSDQLPERIVSVHYVGNTTPIEDPNRDPFDLGPLRVSATSDGVDATGMLSLNGTSIGNWLLYSGPNSFRRIIAESVRVPSPRPVGNNYGGLMVLNFGPVDANAPINTYANDLTKDLSLPNLNQNTLTTTTQGITIGSTAVNVQLWDSTDSLASFEYFVQQPVTSNATVLLPTNATFGRAYHIKLGAYFLFGGNTIRQDYTDLVVQIPATAVLDAGNNTPPLIAVPIGTILQDTPGAIPAGYSFVGVDYDSIQVAPEYNLVATGNSFSGDPLEYKLLDSNVGALLFSPAGYSSFIERPGGPREPLLARVNYDVYDWRVIRQEFRLDNQLGLNGGDYGQFQLDLQSIKVGTNTGPDGLANGVLSPLELSTSPYAATQHALDDNFVIVDLQTGGVVYEDDPTDQHQIVSINKSTGVVTVNGDGAGSGLMGFVAIPGTPGATAVNLAGRSLRVMYRGRNEYSVNVLKAAASYTFVNSNQFTGEGQVFASGNVLQFPNSDRHQQVTIDTIDYTDSGGVRHQLNGQSFQVEGSTVNPTGLPQITLTDPLPAGSTVNNVSGIKGVSIIAQVLWNPGQFHLGSNAATNFSLIDTWENSWRVNRVQTTIPAQEIQ